MHTIKSIYEGWKTFFLGTKPELAKLFQDRLDTCNNCHVNLWGICSACGCPVHTKTKSLLETCPENYWTPFIYEREGELVILVSEIPDYITAELTSSPHYKITCGEYVTLEDWEQALTWIQERDD